jgi:hypothetical protein
VVAGTFKVIAGQDTKATCVHFEITVQGVFHTEICHAWKGTGCHSFDLLPK